MNRDTTHTPDPLESQILPISSQGPADLAYIALASRDISRTASFLGDDLQLPSFKITAPDGVEVEAFRVGKTALVLFSEGHPFLSTTSPGVDHMAVAATDPMKASDASGLPTQPIPPLGLQQSPQTAIDPASTCGVHIRFSQHIQLPSATSELVARIDHLGIASQNNAEAEAIFCGHLGTIYESRQTDIEVTTAIESFTSDKYGMIYHSRTPRPLGGLRVSFLTIGDLELEFLQDADPSHGSERSQGSAGTTKQDQSAIARFIESRGPGLHHVAFHVHNIDGVLKHLTERGHQMIDFIGRPGSRRARIGFIHPSSTGGILFHLVEREELAMP